MTRSASDDPGDRCTILCALDNGHAGPCMTVTQVVREMDRACRDRANLSRALDEASGRAETVTIERDEAVKLLRGCDLLTRYDVRAFLSRIDGARDGKAVR